MKSDVYYGTIWCVVCLCDTVHKIVNKKNTMQVRLGSLIHILVIVRQKAISTGFFFLNFRCQMSRSLWYFLQKIGNNIRTEPSVFGPSKLYTYVGESKTS